MSKGPYLTGFSLPVDGYTTRLSVDDRSQDPGNGDEAELRFRSGPFPPDQVFVLDELILRKLATRSLESRRGSHVLPRHRLPTLVRPMQLPRKSTRESGTFGGVRWGRIQAQQYRIHLGLKAGSG